MVNRIRDNLNFLLVIFFKAKINFYCFKLIRLKKWFQFPGRLGSVHFSLVLLTSTTRLVSCGIHFKVYGHCWIIHSTSAYIYLVYRYAIYKITYIPTGTLSLTYIIYAPVELNYLGFPDFSFSLVSLGLCLGYLLTLPVFSISVAHPCKPLLTPWTLIKTIIK